MRDVADRVGVSAMTVSRVVRGEGRVKPDTAKRVREAIAELGYRPDPLLSVLTGRRKQKGRNVSSASLAVVTPGTDDRLWRDIGDFRATMEGAIETAQTLGYGMEFAFGGESLKSWEQVLRVLLARGVRGLLLPPVQVAVPPGIDWSAFSCVNVGFGVRGSGFHTVRHDNFQMTALALDVLARRGFLRIGVVLTASEVRTHYRVGGAALASSAWGAASGKMCSPLMFDQMAPNLTDSAPREFLAWLRSERPQVIVSLHATRLRRWLNWAGIQVPEEVGLVGLNLNGDLETRDMAGIAISPSQVGAAAADFLHSMILRGETGQPVTRKILALDGVWKDGSSLP